MSLLAITKCFEIQELKGSDKLVFIALADNCNDYFECYPSYPTIAKKASISTRTAIRTVQKLEEMGYLTVKRVNQKSNFYKLNFEPKSIKIPSDKMSPPVKMSLAEPVSNCHGGSDTYDTGVVTPVSPESPINLEEMREEFLDYMCNQSGVKNKLSYRTKLIKNLSLNHEQTVLSFQLFIKQNKPKAELKEPSSVAKERLQNLKTFYNSKSPNELLQIEETGEYLQIFDKVTVNFINKNMGLVALKQRIVLDSFPEHTLAELGGAA